MANSWSFLSDELNMSNQEFWAEDGISLTGNPSASSADTITYSGNPFAETMYIGAPPSDDTISFDYNNDFQMDLVMPKNNNCKYDEDKILKELSEYINGTYKSHYSAGDDKIQTLDLIEACGDGEAFCRSNILKYASCLLYTSPSPRDAHESRMPSSA